MAFREVLTVTAGKSRSAASSAQLIARDASRRASISGEIGESSTTEYLDGTPRPRFASRHSARSADAEASRMRAEANLFIGDLAKEVTEEELETAFGRYGRVLGVDVKRDRATSSSLGYGFVQYSTRREASEGKRALHRHEMHGRSIRVGWAQKNTNLFVGDLDSSVSNEMLRRAFGAFGPLVIEDTFMKVRASRLASRRLGRIERTRPSALSHARKDPRTASRAAALRACCSALLSAAG